MSTIKKSKVKSLRDSLLKSTVVNFDKIFLEHDQEKGKEVVKKHICLPRRLFEDIQYKSMEICWLIPYKSLRSCLPSRDALFWENIDLRICPLEEENLLSIAKSDIPIRQLSFMTILMTNEMFDVIEKFSSNIEVLEIGYPGIIESDISDCHYEENSRDPIKFEKLKKLSLDFKVVPAHLLSRIDLSSCSDSLVHLELLELKNIFRSNENISRFTTFINSIGVLKNLRTLSVQLPRKFGNIQDSLVHLKNLRTLDLPDKYSYDPYKVRLVEVLPLLENLTLHRDNLLVELNSLNGKMLKFAGEKSSESPPENINTFTKKFGSSYNLPSILNSLGSSYSYAGYLYRSAALRIAWPLNETKNISDILTSSQKKEFEKAILLRMGRIRDTIYFAFEDANVYFTKAHENHWSEEFLMKQANIFVSALFDDERIRLDAGYLRQDLMDMPRFQHIVTKYVALNPSSSISKAFHSNLLCNTRN